MTSPRRVILARADMGAELEAFAVNTLEWIRREARLTFEPIVLPPLHCDFRGRHALVVVRGHDYRSDLKALRAYIREFQPVLVAVDGGADALLEVGLKPDIIIGDFDSVSEQALACGADLVHHVHPDGRAPGREQLLRFGVSYVEFVAEGTSEDVAMLLAAEAGAELIVAVGTHASMVEFLDKGRAGMASTFLTRLRLGPLLVDAKGVNRLYETAPAPPGPGHAHRRRLPRHAGGHHRVGAPPRLPVGPVGGDPGRLAAHRGHGRRVINFRFHLVSLVAVFLALALGVVIGSTVIDRAIVDRLSSQIDSVKTAGRRRAGGEPGAAGPDQGARDVHRPVPAPGHRPAAQPGVGHRRGRTGRAGRGRQGRDRHPAGGRRAGTGVLWIEDGLSGTDPAARTKLVKAVGDSGLAVEDLRLVALEALGHRLATGARVVDGVRLRRCRASTRWWR